MDNSQYKYNLPPPALPPRSNGSNSQSTIYQSSHNEYNDTPATQQHYYQSYSPPPQNHLPPLPPRQYREGSSNYSAAQHQQPFISNQRKFPDSHQQYGHSYGHGSSQPLENQSEQTGIYCPPAQPRSSYPDISSYPSPSPSIKYPEKQYWSSQQVPIQQHLPAHLNQTNHSSQISRSPHQRPTPSPQHDAFQQPVTSQTRNLQIHSTSVSQDANYHAQPTYSHASVYQQDSSDPRLPPPLTSPLTASKSGGEANSYYSISSKPSQNDPVDDISVQLGQMNMGSTHSSDNPRNQYSTTHTQIPPSVPLSYLPITVNGPPATHVTVCPEDRALDQPFVWYHEKNNETFTICSKCYSDYIKNSPFSQEFLEFTQLAGKQTRCRFDTPRVKEQLWPNAIRSRDMTRFREHITRRMQIQDCHGSEGVQADANVKWFTTQDEKPQEFIICEACFEDKALATLFGNHFKPHQLLQREGETWACDLSSDFIARALKTCAQSNSWSKFVNAITHRLSLPTCSSAVVQANSLRWYRPRRHIPGMVICETCREELIALTLFAQEFEQISTAGEPDTAQWQCDLGPAARLRIAWSSALDMKHFPIFWDAAHIVVQSPPCSAEGIDGGIWYTLKNGCDNFDICAACYATIICPNLSPQVLSQCFELANRDPQAKLCCDLNPGSLRFAAYILKLQEAIDRGSMRVFTAYVRKFAPLPPCPKMDPQSGSSWYGYADCTICAECYFSTIEGTSLASQMPLQGIPDPRPTVCHMYSARMRGKWDEACAKDNPDELIAFAKHRLGVYNQVMPAIKASQQLRLVRQAQALHYGHLSVMYQGMDSLASVSGTTDGHRYGNSSLGWYDTQNGLQGAKYFQQMQDGLRNNNRPDEIMMEIQLEQAWRQVE